MSAKPCDRRLVNFYATREEIRALKVRAAMEDTTLTALLRRYLQSLSAMPAPGGIQPSETPRC